MNSLKEEWQDYKCINNKHTDKIHDCGCKHDLLVVIVVTLNEIENTRRKIRSYDRKDDIRFILVINYAKDIYPETRAKKHATFKNSTRVKHIYLS
eukprot:UN32350